MYVCMYVCMCVCVCVCVCVYDVGTHTLLYACMHIVNYYIFYIGYLLERPAIGAMPVSGEWEMRYNMSGQSPRRLSICKVPAVTLRLSRGGKPRVTAL